MSLQILSQPQLVQNSFSVNGVLSATTAVFNSISANYIYAGGSNILGLSGGGGGGGNDPTKLPLTGGTITGDLTIVGTLFVNSLSASGVLYGDGSKFTFNNGLTVNTFTSAVSLSAQSGVFSTGNMLLGQNEGGSYFGRTEIKESQLYTNNNNIKWNMVDSNLRDYIAFAMSSDGQYQTALTTSYGIFRSTDYGVTWNNVDSNVRTYRGISMSLDGKYQTAVVYSINAVFGSQTIYRSTNYGATWTMISDDFGRRYTSVAMSSDGRIQTLALYNDTAGGIFRSTDYGVTYSPVDNNTRNYLSIGMSSDGKYQTAVCNGGAVGNRGIFRSTDYGVTWNNVDSNSRNYKAISMSSDGKYQLAVGGVYAGFRSTNYGLTWTDISISGAFEANYNAAAVSSNGKIQLVMAGNGVAMSPDYGATWSIVYPLYNGTGIGMSSDAKMQIAVTNGSGLFRCVLDSVLEGNLTVTSSVSAPALSGTHYGDGGNLSGVIKTQYTPPANATFTSSVSAPALSGTHYGDGSKLTGIAGTYTPPANATFTSSVSAPALSGTFYGDGSKLTGIAGTYTPPANATFTSSVSAPALSGTHYGDGSKLTFTNIQARDASTNYPIGGITFSNGFVSLSASSFSQIITFDNGGIRPKVTIYGTVSALSLSGIHYGDGNNLSFSNIQARDILSGLPNGGITFGSNSITLSTTNTQVMGIDTTSFTKATIYGSVSAQSLSGTFYGDGSNLLNLKITTVVNGSKSGTYTLALADAGSVVSFNSTSSNICQIPANSVVPFAIGTQMIVIQEGTGTVTFQIVPSSGVDLKYYNNKNITSGQYSLATLVKVGTDSWRLGGTLS